MPFHSSTVPQKGTRNRRRRHAAVLAVAALAAEAVGVALCATPSLAAAQADAQGATITITVGGDRIGDVAVAGLADVRFDVFAGTKTGGPAGGAVGSCTSAGDGTCSVSVPPVSGSDNGYWVKLADVPGGWSAQPTLGVDPGPVPVTYGQVFTGPLTAGQVLAVPVAAPNGSAPTSQSGVFAVSRDDPGLPEACGLRVALLFDLSSSIGGNLPNLKNAGNGFVTALTGTPSSVAVYTFANVAPAPGAGNTTLPLTPVSTATSAATVTSKITGLALDRGTNWDSGLWQIANSADDYDVAVVLTDGNPTSFGPNGQSNLFTHFAQVENAIFSANALKAKHTAVIAVGIGLTGTGSATNLAAISGPAEGENYYTTNFSALSALLKSLALKNCAGTVNVAKLVIPADHPGDLTAAQPAPGWDFTAKIGRAHV